LLGEGEQEEFEERVGLRGEEKSGERRIVLKRRRKRMRVVGVGFVFVERLVVG